jgi:glycerophosphoryl diester phosphodiesterase
LDDAMAACEGVRVNVEIKNRRNESEAAYDESGDFARQVVRHLQEIDWADRVIISSFDQATCAAARSFDADIKVGWLLWKVDMASAVTQAHVLGFTAVHPHYKDLDASAMVTAKELELEVNAWTVNSRRALSATVEHGVNAIITDQPARAKVIAENALAN